MKLKRMRIQNFRSLRDVTIPFQPDLTVLVGENDSGKSSVLDLLEWILGAPYLSPAKMSRPGDVDFTASQDGTAETIIVDLEFEVPKGAVVDVSPDWLKDEGDKKILHLRVIYSRDGDPRFEVQEQQFEVPEVGMSEPTLKRKRNEQLDDILKKLGIEPTQYTTKDAKIEAITSARDRAPRKWQWKEVTPRALRFLPRIQRYRALEYKEPEKYLEKTLKAVFANALRSRSRRNPEETLAAVRQLQSRAQSQLEAEVRQLENFIRRFIPDVQRISYSPDIRFEEALRGGELLIDTGHGLHPLSRVGDGTKRRMVMAAMEWEREVLRRIGSTEPVLRAYDEPDTNLHYNAQRQFFRAVRNLLQENPSQQAVLCTHSLFMIDHAPAQSLVHLYRDENGHTQVETLPVYEDEEIARFLETIAAQLGVIHSSLFFDRCFLLVEGETEFAALPILYQKRYDRTLREDGIALIHLGGVKSPAVLFRLLGERRARYVLFLIDADEFENKKQRLQNQGWNATLTEQAIIPIGEREFEDVFPDDLWAQVAQEHWPRADGTPWRAEHFAGLREGEKFSESLRVLIQREARVKGGIGKPLLGQRLAETIDANQIPEAILELFHRARQIAGVEEDTP